MDATNIQYDEYCFDYIFDKWTFDCILSSTTTDPVQKAHSMIEVNFHLISVYLIVIFTIECVQNIE